MIGLKKEVAKGNKIMKLSFFELWFDVRGVAKYPSNFRGTFNYIPQLFFSTYCYSKLFNVGEKIKDGVFFNSLEMTKREEHWRQSAGVKDVAIRST